MDNRCHRLTEERVVERHRLDLPHVEVIQHIRVEVEEHGHIDRLAGPQPLLLEAEALDLAKVRRHLRGRDAVRGHADDVLVARVGGRVEGQCRLAGEHADLALLRRELPGKHVRDGRVEGYAEARGGGDGVEAGGDVGVGLGGVDADGLAAPADLLADLGCVSCVVSSRGRGWERTIL